MQQSEFEELVAEAVDALPEIGKQKMQNVVFLVEPELRQKKSEKMHIKRGSTMLGLYQGVSKANRGSAYSGVLPDKITIFEGPIRALAGDNPIKLKEIVFDVVRHEVGHHLGFNETDIRAYERVRRQQKKD